MQEQRRLAHQFVVISLWCGENRPDCEMCHYPPRKAGQKLSERLPPPPFLSLHFTSTLPPCGCRRTDGPPFIFYFGCELWRTTPWVTYIDVFAPRLCDSSYNLKVESTKLSERGLDMWAEETTLEEDGRKCDAQSVCTKCGWIARQHFFFSFKRRAGHQITININPAFKNYLWQACII